jgi:hypothetical protein
MKTTIELDRRCNWCGAYVNIKLNGNSTAATARPILAAFTKVHSKTCEHPRYGMRNEVTTKTE